VRNSLSSASPESGWPFEGPLGADAEDARLGHQLGQVGARVGQRLFLLVSVQQVHLVDDEHHLVAAAAQQLAHDELALALFQDLPGIQQEEHGVCLRNVLVGDLGARVVQVVDARGVDEDHALAQHRVRVLEVQVLHAVGHGRAAHLVVRQVLEGHRLFGAIGADRRGAALGPVPNAVDDGRGGRDARGQHRAAQQRVHEGGLAVVELAQHHQVEALVAQPRDAVLLEGLGHGGGTGALGQARHVAKPLERLGFQLGVVYCHVYLRGSRSRAAAPGPASGPQSR
jgi:hypothetical protein